MSSRLLVNALDGFSTCRHKQQVSFTQLINMSAGGGVIQQGSVASLLEKRDKAQVGNHQVKMLGQTLRSAQSRKESTLLFFAVSVTSLIGGILMFTLKEESCCRMLHAIRDDLDGWVSLALLNMSVYVTLNKS